MVRAYLTVVVLVFSLSAVTFSHRMAALIKIYIAIVVLIAHYSFCTSCSFAVVEGLPPGMARLVFDGRLPQK